jgi:hypothetical protein
MFEYPFMLAMTLLKLLFYLHGEEIYHLNNNKYVMDLFIN